MEKGSTKGFTLLELVISVATIGILLTIATPLYSSWMEESQYREAARNIASALREARARAIATNREHRVEFDISANSYRMTQGDSSTGSSSFSSVTEWDPLPATVRMKRNKECDNETNVNIHFNPNGTSNSQYVCVMDDSASPVKKFLVGVSSSTTGKIIIER